MAANFLFKRTSTENKRPDPTLMSNGEVDLCYAYNSAGLFFKNVSGSLVKVGPAQISATAPNSTPAGSAGNSVGEFWYDTSATPVLKIWDGSTWEIAGVTTTVSPAGSNTQIQYNDNGSFGASADFTFNNSALTVSQAGVAGSARFTLGAAGSTGLDPNIVYFSWGDGTTPCNLSFQSEPSSGTQGGNLTLQGGIAGVGGIGGSVYITSGNNAGAPNGSGDIVIRTPSGGSGSATIGDIDIITGGGLSGDTFGNINLIAGKLAGTIPAGQINLDGIVNLGSVNYLHITGGSSGQYLQTNGAGDLTWAAAGGAGTITLDSPVYTGVQVNGVGPTDTFTVAGNGSVYLSVGTEFQFEGRNDTYTVTNVVFDGGITTTVTVDQTWVDSGYTPFYLNRILKTVSPEPAVAQIAPGPGITIDYNDFTSEANIQIANYAQANELLFIDDNGLFFGVTGVTSDGTSISMSNSNIHITGGTSGQYLQTDGAGNLTWASTGAGTGTVTSVATGTGLTGGPITTSGTIDLADTAVTPGTYNFATLTVDQQGRLTAASSGTPITEVTAGTGLSGGGTSGSVTLTNTGVTSIAAGTNISVSGGTGDITISSTAVAGNPAGSNTQVQFNNSGVFGASPNFFYNSGTDVLNVDSINANADFSLTTGVNPGGDPGWNISLKAGQGVGNIGGDVQIEGGDDGGSIRIYGAFAYPGAVSGYIELRGGAALAAGTVPGYVDITGGESALGGVNGGDVRISGGFGQVAANGNVEITDISVASAKSSYTPTAATDLTTKSYVDQFSAGNNRFYGEFSSTITQANQGGAGGATPGQANLITYNTTIHSNQVTVNNGSQVTFANAGIYNIQFSVQWQKSDSGTDTVYLWFRKNGVDVADSNSSWQLTGNGDRVIGSLNYINTFNADDYIELAWWSADVNLNLTAAAAAAAVPGVSPALPAIPSVILTAVPV